MIVLINGDCMTVAIREGESINEINISRNADRLQ
jgi:hypothetical protein